VVAVNLVYVMRRFPKTSETFILHEIREILRQGDRVTICSLRQPYPDEPRHAGVAELAPLITYVPDGRTRRVSLFAAAASAVLRSPRRALPALAWAIRGARRQRRLSLLKEFGEAAWLSPRIPPDADHIHAHFAHGPASVALLLSRLTGLPFSFTAHANDIFQLELPPLLRAKVAEASFAVTESEHTRAHLAGFARPGDRGKLVVVHNGVDLARFAPRSADPSAVPVLLSVSRLVEKKGVDTLFDACRRLADDGITVRCEVIGDGPVRAELVRRAHELGVSDRVELLGNRDDDAVLAALRRASVFTLACRQAQDGDRDCLPVAILEALACGLPVVTTRISGIPEVVDDGRSGLLVPSDAPDALAAAIERVLRDRALRDRLGRGGRRAVEAGFDERRTVAQLRALFAASRRRPRHRARRPLSPILSAAAPRRRGSRRRRARSRR
jgi:glycosyltransferase involved in cell wall biosynthesis